MRADLALPLPGTLGAARHAPPRRIRSIGATFFAVVAVGLLKLASPAVPLALLEAPPWVLCGGAGVVNGAEPIRATGAAPRPVPTVVSSHPLTDRPGKRVTAVVVDFVPGAMSPPHRHGGDVSVYVLEGTVRSQLGSGPMETFGPGGTFFEPHGIIHTHSSNPSATEHAKILAIFVHDDGATLTTYLE
jgi:quercetin dioxygenase-like cupin family protein